MVKISYVLKGHREVYVDEATWRDWERSGYIERAHARVVKQPLGIDREVVVELVGELNEEGKEQLFKEIRELYKSLYLFFKEAKEAGAK